MVWFGWDGVHEMDVGDGKWLRTRPRYFRTPSAPQPTTMVPVIGNRHISSYVLSVQANARVSFGQRVEGVGPVWSTRKQVYTIMVYMPPTLNFLCFQSKS